VQHLLSLPSFSVKPKPMSREGNIRILKKFEEEGLTEGGENSV
jgi:hypothetical protein